jgi:ribosome-associated protein
LSFASPQIHSLPHKREANSIVIAEGLVFVSGQVETRKRKKIVSGDIIEFGNEKFCIQLK